MKISLPLLSVLFIATLPAPPAIAGDAAPADGQAQQPLFGEISALDTAVFDAFNRCSDPAQLQKHAGYFDAGVEFYHDTGGVTWTREAMIANTAKYVCGNFRRELIPGSLKVYPIKDFGAVEQGVHRFCQAASGSCEGLADFVIVWRQRDGKWEITRVLSYGHRALAVAQ
ncbi:MAG: nuclear transport factor 2 family protein [Pseudoxanthomonas sp.]